MKISIVYFLSFLLAFLPAYGAFPPTTIKGQSDTAKATTFNFQVPNNQATRIDSTTALIETGNGNLLVNPGFEASTVSSGWTQSAQVVSSSSSSARQGKVALQQVWTPLQTGDHLLLSQSITATQNFKGQQIDIGVALQVVSLTNADTSTVKLCYKVNGSAPVGVLDGGCQKNVSLTQVGTSAYLPMILTTVGDVAGTVYTFEVYGNVTSISPTPVITLRYDAAYFGDSKSFGYQKSDDTLTALINCSGSSSVSRVTPVGSNWISVGNISSGTCAVTLSGFTSTPNCNITPMWGGTSQVISPIFEVTSPTSGTITLTITNNSSIFTGSNVNYPITCEKTGSDRSESRTLHTSLIPKTPNIVRYTSGSGTYTPTPGTKYIEVEMVGGGAGGGGSGVSPGTPGQGTATTFGTSLLTAGNGGNLNTINSPAIVKRNILGTVGLPRQDVYNSAGGAGGNSFFTGAGYSGSAGAAGGDAKANTGSGGGGAGGYASGPGGYGGNAGSYILAKIDAPSGSYPYTVGTGGAGGTAGTGGTAGGAGVGGIIIITEYFSSDVNAIIAQSVYVGATIVDNADGASYASGTYNPTWTNLTNITSLTVGVTWWYLRIGSNLFVGGHADITPTAANTFTEAQFSLPAITFNNFSNNVQCTGSNNNYGILNERRGPMASVSGDKRIRMRFTSGASRAADTQIISVMCKLQ